MAKPTASRRQLKLKTARQRYWRGEREVMQDRSNTGSRENPSWLECPEHALLIGTRSADRMRASDRHIAQTGRTHSCTRLACITGNLNLAKPGPSTASQAELRHSGHPRVAVGEKDSLDIPSALASLVSRAASIGDLRSLSTPGHITSSRSAKPVQSSNIISSSSSELGVRLNWPLPRTRSS